MAKTLIGVIGAGVIGRTHVERILASNFAPLRHLCDVARGDAQPLISVADGTATLRATLAVLEAARTRAAVDLNQE
jgi:hypothetical protein